MHKSLPAWSFHSSVRQTVPKINKQIIEDMRNERVVEAMEERGREGKGREGKGGWTAAWNQRWGGPC